MLDPIRRPSSPDWGERERELASRGERASGGGLVSGNDKDKRRQHDRRGETSEGEKRTVRPSVDRRWEEARFIESRGPIVKLLAIPIENASFRQQYCTCFATVNLFQNRFISSRVTIANEREMKKETVKYWN